MAIMALDEDESVDFSISEPVSTYLPFDGVYADRTVEQMVSNTSGIPGLRLLDGYGSPTGPTLQDFNHLCQFSAQPFMNFEMCGQMLVQNELPTTNPAGSVFDYGGSQWQIAGLTASIVNNSTWNQLFDEYIAAPCELEVFTFGNPWEELSASGNTYTSFDGATVESMPGQHNPSVEGGGITNLSDYAKLLQVHLNGGYCGDTQVLSEASLESMRQDRGSMTFNPTPYGMGWWISSAEDGVYTDPGDWGDESFTTTSDGEPFYYTSATGITKSWAESHGCEVTNSAVVFDAGTSEAECRTYCSSDSGWPRVLDCRSDMGHTYEFSWTWPLVLEFFTAHSL